MASFTQFRAAAGRGVVKRFTWVCGSERALVEEVVNSIQVALRDNPDGLLTIGYAAELDRESLIWDTCASIPSLGPRLVIVRQADALKRWDSLYDMIAAGRLLSGSWVIFVSELANYPYIEGEDKLLPGHISAIRDSSAGALVRCSRPSEDDLFKWVIDMLPGAGKVLASYVLDRAGGDLELVKIVCRKAALFASVGEALIDVLISEQPAEEFADSLVHLRRDHALDCLDGITDREMLKAFGLLDSRLALLTTLAPAVRQRMTEQDMRERLKVNTVLIKKFRAVAPQYDAARIHKCRQLLSMAESAWRAGAREGVPEALVALW